MGGRMRKGARLSKEDRAVASKAKAAKLREWTRGVAPPTWSCGCFVKNGEAPLLPNDAAQWASHTVRNRCKLCSKKKKEQEEDAAFFYMKSISRSDVRSWNEIPPELRKYFDRKATERAIREVARESLLRIATWITAGQETPDA